MAVAAIICEYNPLHAGHAKHLQITRQRGASHIVCIMSGAFTQRGEAAIADKWTRAAMALRAGADIVVELPVLYSLQSAEGFARGAVRIAAALHADVLSFGAEEGRIDVLTRAAHLLSAETPAMAQTMRSSLQQGNSHARAKQEALTCADASLGGLLLGPNNILALEYLQAMQALAPSIEPMIIERNYPAENRRDDRGRFMTSSSIRSAVRDAAANGTLPEVLESLGYPPDFVPMLAEDRLFSLLLYAIRSADDLTVYAGIDAPVAARIARGAELATSWESLVQVSSTRWLTQSRLRRALLHILLRTTKEMLKSVNSLSSPLHARLLGFRRQQKEFLGRMIGSSDIPIVTRYKEYPNTGLAGADLRASDLYTLLPDPPLPASTDKTHPPIIL